MKEVWTYAMERRQIARQLASSIDSSSLSRLSVEELRRLDAVREWFKIEMRELTASPKQLDFQEAFFHRKDKSGRKVSVFSAIGANRSGKSILAGWLCFAKHLMLAAEGGSWYWTVAQTLDRSIGGVQQELWNALPRECFKNQTWDEKIGFGMHRKIILPARDGGKILVEFRSADQSPSTFEQAKLSGVWCDERMDEGIFDRLIPRVVDKDGFILYSDIPESWWQWERLINAEATAGVYHRHFTMYDNAANLPAGSIAQAAALMTEDQRRQRIDGEMVAMEGLVYKEFSEASHVIEPFVIPLDWPRWRAIDYGGSSPTACIWTAIGPNECIYVYREHYQRNESVSSHARAIVAASEGEEYVETWMDPHAVDPPPIYYGTSATVAEQYEEGGIKAKGWPFVQIMGEHALVQRVKKKLEMRQIKVFNTCINTVREFKSWKYKCDKDGRPLASDAFENDNNHVLDALRSFISTNPSFVVEKCQVFGRGA